MRQNSPELWDELWDKPLSHEQDIFALAKEEHTVRWLRITREVLRVYGTDQPYQNLKVIELGAGSGTYAALLAKRGAQVTILDYSDRALDRGREFFQRNALSADFIKHDALALPLNLQDQFDISMSFGLAEHFHGTARQQIIQAHFDVLKPGGITFVSVPNKFCPPYRIFKFVAQRMGKWIFGEEYPSSRAELTRLARQSGAGQTTVLGGSLLASFDFINPFKALAIVRRVLQLTDNLDPAHIRHEQATFLDHYLAYALVLAAQKPQIAHMPS